jgi:cytochrome c oxidase subunit 2
MGSLKWKSLMSAAVLGLTLLSLGSTRHVSAQEPRVIDISAKRYGFTPDKITLKKGEPVTLRLHSEDVIHGFFSRQLKIDETIEPGKTAEVTLTPQTDGTFTTICDHFCGAGHGNMAMTIVVE